MAAFPTTVATDADLYIAVNATSTQLTDNPLTAGATTVNVTSTAAFPTVGFISIDNEIIKYTGKTGTSFTGCTRAADGTAATSHVQNSQVFHNVIAAHHNVLKDEIIAVEANLSTRIGLSTTQILAGTDGSTTVPFYSFASQTTMGWRRVGANKIAYVAGSVDMVTIDSGTLDLTNNASLSMSSGNAAGPILSHRSNTDSGLYWPTTTSIAYSADGTAVCTIRGDNSVDLGIYLNRGYLKFGTGAGNAGDGTVAAPILSWESDGDLGIFRPAANCLGIAANGVEYLRIGVTGSAGAVASNAVGGFSNTISSAGNVAIFYAIHTDNTNGASHSVFQVTTGGASGGDPYIGFLITGQTGFSCGLDNSDGDKWKISGSSTLGSNDTFIINPATLGVETRGTNTNDDAPTGFQGQYVSAVVSSSTLFPANGTYGDLTSISLTAGDWDISVGFDTTQNGATVTRLQCGISANSGNNSAGLTRGDNLMDTPIPVTSVRTGSASIANFRVKLTATTTYYLKYYADFSAGTPQATGRISARRVR